MHFLIAGHLKPEADKKLIDYHDAFNEHLGQSALGVVMAGVLRDENGRRVGYLALMKSDSIDLPRAWLRESPFYQAGLYERTEIYEYHNQIGDLD